MKIRTRMFRNEGRAQRRILVEGRSAVYHVMSRTVRGRFWLNVEEKHTFRKMVLKQCAFTGLELLAYCLMDNHFHLLMRVPEAPLGEAGKHGLTDDEILSRYAAYYGETVPQSTYSVAELKSILAAGGEEAEEARCVVLARMGNLPAFMRELKQRYVFWFNRKHENKGTIWAARYKSVVVEDSPFVLSKVAAYIDLNPVRAEITDDPATYPFCSYADAMAGRKEAREGLLKLFHASGANEYNGCMRSYRLILFGKGAAFKTGTEAGGKERGRVAKERIAAILKAGGEVSLSEALRCRTRYFSDGGALGGAEFIGEIIESCKRSIGTRRKGGGKPFINPVWGGLMALRDLKRNLLG